MYEKELAVARAAADKAAQVIASYYGREITVAHKRDGSPVTQADTDAESIIRETLCDAFPEYGFYGEESGGKVDAEGFTWLVDPLDGTKSFVRGYPFVSTQIALWHRGKTVVGVSAAPIFKETAYAALGHGAWLNGKRLSVSKVGNFGEATLSSGNIGSLATSPSWPRYGSLVRQCNRTRGYGDFYHYHLLASGRIDLVIESDLNILDIAALSLVVSEAGGKFTSLEGKPIDLECTTVLASNSVLHSRAVTWLAWQG